MPEILDDYDFGSGGGRYPWDEWLDGQIRKLVYGEDFTVKASSLVTSAKKQANKRGKGLRTRTDGENVVLQATQATT